VSTRAPEPLVRVAFWSKQPSAFNRAHVPVARWIAYHFSLGARRSEHGKATHHIDNERLQGADAGVLRRVDRLNAATQLHVVGESAEWREVQRKGTQVAATDTTVLITGESGTGKEVVARFIHAASARRTGPFVALNCAALPEQLLESELFGYERGAFTSAQQSKPGQIELAAGGVLFLDEVTEMSLSAQAKFLRVLQEREFQRLGATRPIKANIRVIAATNRDLRKGVERGDFREDLFYRLGVFDIQIPPLRERPSDIGPMSAAFLQEIGRSFGRAPASLTRDAEHALLNYHWPGNVRELRNVLERASILCEGSLIETSHLALQSAARSFSTDTTTDLGVVERTTIAKVLQQCRGNKTKAARRLGLSRTQLHLRIRKYRLEEAAAA
jgi:transcriptional regulator with PAS, ATPase and Fis domain